MTKTTPNSNPPKTARGYLRVSHESQVESGLSLKSQKELIRKYAKSKGLRIAKYYTDAGISGTKGIEQRPALDQLLKDLKNTEILLVSKRDRIARSVYLSAFIDRKCQQINATIESADGTGNGATPADEMMKQLVSVFAEYERNLISERTRNAMSKLTRKVGRLPYGWKWDAQGRQIKDQTQYPTVERILELREDGVGYRTIAKLLDKENRPTQRGGKWNPTSVMRICGRLEGKRMSKWMQREQEATDKELKEWEK
jgi:DNA invertase Pin-like site-specific DNA recombinase